MYSKLEEKKILLHLDKKPLFEIRRGEDLHRGRKLKRLKIKKAKRINLSGREIYFFEASYNRVEIKYTLCRQKNSWTFISCERDKSPESDWDWKKIVIFHLFPEKVEDLQNEDEVELLADFVEMRNLMKELISKYGK